MFIVQRIPKLRILGIVGIEDGRHPESSSNYSGLLSHNDEGNGFEKKFLPPEISKGEGQWRSFVSLMTSGGEYERISDWCEGCVGKKSG